VSSKHASLCTKEKTACLANHEEFILVSTLRLMRELQTKRESGLTDVFGEDEADLLRSDGSGKAFRAYIRLAFCSSRTRTDRILAAKFSRTYTCFVFWLAIIIAPYFLFFVVRLATNPQWIHCSGCEIEPTDAWAYIVFTILGNISGDLSNSFRVRKRDALRIVRESMLNW